MTIDTSTLPTTPGPLPSDIASGSWTMTFASTYGTSNGFTWQTILGTGDEVSGVFISPGGSNIFVYVAGSPVASTGYVLEYSPGQPISLALDAVAGSITVSGATAGNGVYVGSSWSWTGSNWQFGIAGSSFPYFGTISNVETSTVTITGDMSATLGVLAPTTASAASQSVATSSLPTSAAALPVGLLASRWRATFTSDYGTTIPSGVPVTQTLLFGHTGLLVFTGAHPTLAGRIRVYNDSAVAAVTTSALVYSPGQTIEIVVDPIAGTLQVIGATSGDGVHAGTPWTWTNDAMWRWGNPWIGTISDVHTEGASSLRGEVAIAGVGLVSLGAVTCAAVARAFSAVPSGRTLAVRREARVSTVSAETRQSIIARERRVARAS